MKIPDLSFLQLSILAFLERSDEPVRFEPLREELARLKHRSSDPGLYTLLGRMITAGLIGRRKVQEGQQRFSVYSLRAPGRRALTAAREFWDEVARAYVVDEARQRAGSVLRSTLEDGAEFEPPELGAMISEIARRLEFGEKV